MKKVVLLLLLMYLFLSILPYIPFQAVDFDAAVPETEAYSDDNVDIADWVVNGSDSLMYRLKMISQAKEHIWISNYMFKPDKTGSQVMAALLKAADRGVQVRIILDGLIGLLNMGLDAAPYVLGAHPNIEIQMYQVLNLLYPQGFNDVLHEKYMVVDGEWLLLGGRNISDAFLLEAHPAYSYDLEVILHKVRKGKSAANLLEDRFRFCWDAPQTAIKYEKVPPGLHGAVEQRRKELYAIADTLHEEMSGPVNLLDFVSIQNAALYTTPLSPHRKQDTVFQAMMVYLHSAREHAILVSPYFVMDKAMKQSLLEAMKQPGSAIILTNSDTRGNNLIAISDKVFHGGWEQETEAAVYALQMPRSLHTKAMLIDHQRCLIGSFNMDMRSAYIDTECMLMLDSRPLAEKLEKHLNSLLEASAPMNEAARAISQTDTPALPTSWIKRIKIYLLAPLVAIFRFLV